ncbi:uncharacterized protein BP5553_04215 [Venustampulla echinocandica]|uniref:MYND-type domain-containing protein n=1 Tax=Venustampulla echinocandica TaxID=2656787 RepID=A0A370TWH3_9HELO|nr:uncharacterized protein BP5553_04215 [Venustampulla echinocandica]RDL39875.1 hypothetical protein BP5553_04215 [Venustampulla echinocandica]
MEATVQAFNNLPRPQTTPSGLSSYWYLAVRHVPLNPPSDLVHLVHPESTFMHTAGPKDILSLPTPGAQADIVVPLLLESFVKGLDRGPNGEVSEVPPFAPWTWGTKDAGLARAIEAKLKALGVREDLCSMGIGSKRDNDASDETWSVFLSKLKELTGQGAADTMACSSCKKGASTFSTPLLRCAGCLKASYCSKRCQKNDWKEHKKVCVKSPESSPRDPFTYYNTIAHTVPEAKDLAKSVNLTLPTGATEGLEKPIRRLIITGNDTPKNLQLFLGPGWKSIETSIYKPARINVLLHPPPGSPSYAIYGGLDAGAPSLSPRQPSPAESEEIKTIRDLQATLSKHLGSRKEVTPQDMQVVLSSFGANWDRMLPFYEIAVNSMDQGVVVP